jgi:LPS-assembly lipoprotein
MSLSRIAIIRRPLLAAVLSSITLVVPGCGFELRRAPELRFATIAFTGFTARSPLAEELRRQLATSTTTRAVDAAAQAQVVLEALSDVREKSVVASTAAGQVREVQLRTRLQFRLRTPTGRELIAPAEIRLARDMSYNETAALAKEQEEALLFRAMDADIAQQVLRRLAAVQGL